VLFSSSAAQTVKDDYPWAWSEEAWLEWLATIRSGWGTRAWIVRNARWMGPSMLDSPDELEHWITYTRLAASPSSAEAVMRQSKDTDIREVLPVIQAPTLVLHRIGDQVEDIAGARYVASKIPHARLVELPGKDGIPWLGDVDRVLSEIHGFLAEDRDRRSDPDRRLATVLFTDFVGSTDLVVALGDRAWKAKLADHDAVVDREITRHNGHLVDTAGDGVLATFDGPAAAVRCAHAIMQGVEPLDLQLRAGVHTGEVEVAGHRIRGVTVHTGARIAGLAAPSQVLVSQTVKDLTAGSGLRLASAGNHYLKGIPGRWTLYDATLT
jgi:class 3 adenylate cyclase